MAKKRKSRRGPDAESTDLAELPQVPDEVWQADVRRSPAWVRIGDELERPWMILVTNRTDDLVMAHEMPNRQPSATMLWDQLTEAMSRPEVGPPHRPTEIQLSRPEFHEALDTPLAEIGVQCVVLSSLEHLDYVLDDLSKHLQGGRTVPILTDVPGMDVEHASRFYAAAAQFFRRAAWNDDDSDLPIRVESSRFESGPWFAVVMGQSGVVQGLALHEGEDTLNAILDSQSEEIENVRNTSAISLMYGEKFEIAVKDLDAAEELGWQIAAPNAYPFAIRVNPGRAVRAPLVWELELLEACLYAIPDFLELGQSEARVKIPVIASDMDLVLSRYEG